MKQKETSSRIFDASIGVDRQGRDTEFTFNGRTRVSTKALITLVSIGFGTGLLIFAQISSFGQLIVETLRRFIKF